MAKIIQDSLKNKELTREQREQMNQPEYRRFDPYYSNLSEKDEKAYEKITELYKELCDLDITFYIGTILPDSCKQFSPYRFTRPEVCYTEEGLKKINSLLWQMYYFLYCNKYLHCLEKHGYIKILKKLEIDENDINLLNNKDQEELKELAKKQKK